MRILVWHTRLPKAWPLPERLDPSAPPHEQWFGAPRSDRSLRWLEKFKAWGDR